MKAIFTRLFTIVTLAISGFSLTANAQNAFPTVTLKDGRTLETHGVRRSGDNLMIKTSVGTGLAEVGYPLATVQSVHFPKPAVFQEAKTLLNSGKAALALQKIDPQVSYFEPLKDIPGNLWAEAALIKSSALIDLGRQAEATLLINQLATTSGDPEAVFAAKLRLAEAELRTSNRAAAETTFRDTIQNSKNSDTIAQAWADLGEGLYMDMKYREAVSAYLHVPVFYSGQRQAMPKALLGAAQSLIKIHDKQHAKSYLDQLTQNYPNSPEKPAAENLLRTFN